MSVGVMQLIDTLDAGGAERVAVNLANWLAKHGYRSYLCISRRGGALEREIQPGVQIIKLNRRSRYDFLAGMRLAGFLRKHHIDILHAHSTSLFLGAAAAVLSPQTRLIWHDHFGAWGIEKRSVLLYRLAARFAGGIVVVNHDLERWAVNDLGCRKEKVHYLPNFIAPYSGMKAVMDLPGEQACRVICVGNLRPQKDHATLLRAAELVIKKRPGAHFFMVGSNANEEYSRKIRALSNVLGLEERVHWLGHRTDVSSLLKSCGIGVLASVSEGFPLALLEYGAAGLAVISTDTGQCAEILEDGRAGLLVPPRDPFALAAGLLRLMEGDALRFEMAERYHQHIENHYSADAVLPRLLKVYKSLLRQDIHV